MPVLPVVRLPLPNLRTYAIISTLLFTVSVFHARSWIGGDPTPNSNENSFLDAFFEFFASNENENEEGRVYLFLRSMIKEPWCLVAFINQAYCCLIIFGKVIQKIVFGRLRVVEQQHAKDKFWNFVFYKFIYIFGVMNVQEVEEIVLWFSWFSVLGFLHILSTLSKDRFEYNSSSPSIPRKAHTKVLALLVYLHLCSWFLLVLSVYFWIHYVSINTFAFMMAESLMLIIKTLYVLVRYNIHLWDATHEGTWENRAVLVYYSDFIFEVSALLVDFFHHLHMLLYGNIFLSMASLVIGMQLRYLFYELRRRIKRHENYRRVVSSMETKFPMASLEDLKENDDDCAICWERMDAARRLPCGHVFHNTCLRSWLEQDTTCPTCRLNLRELQKVNTDTRNDPLHIGAPDDLNVGRLVDNALSQTGANRIHQNSPPLPQNRRVATVVGSGRRTSYFHFDGSRILSWLPSFSVEVTQSNLLSNVFGQTSTIDHMVRQVREIFPNYPDIVIRDDIRITRSVEMTIDNIVEGRLIIPAGMSEHGRMTSPDTNIRSSMAMDENMVTVDSDVILEDNYQGTLDTAAALLSDLSSDVQEVRLVYATSSNSDDDDHLVDSNNDSLTSLSPPKGSSSIETRNSEIHHHMSTDPSSRSSTDRPDNQAADCIGMGYRFSKSSAEREGMLQLRKKKLIEEARRKYIEKNNFLPSAQSVAKDSSSTGHAPDSNSSRYNSPNQTTSDAAIRRRFFPRGSTEGSPVDIVQSPSRNGIFGFINQ